MGWNTGVGLFAFGSDKLEQMNIFRGIIRTLKIGNKCFESYPKRMLLNRYALMIYFNAAFQWNSELKLLFFIKKLNGFKGELTMAETRFYPEDHPTRKGCKIVACEADQQFLDELYKYPKDHAFSIRFSGNLYIRGGERIDPDDPDAVRQRRPKLTRSAAKKFIQGSGEDILNNGQRMDNEAAKAARAEHMRKYVGRLLLFTNFTRYSNSKAIQNPSMAFLRVTVGKKQRYIFHYFRESKQRCSNFNNNMMVGYGKVERGCLASTAQIKVLEIRRKLGEVICNTSLNGCYDRFWSNVNIFLNKLCRNENKCQILCTISNKKNSLICRAMTRVSTIGTTLVIKYYRCDRKIKGNRYTGKYCYELVNIKGVIKEKAQLQGSKELYYSLRKLGMVSENMIIKRYDCSVSQYGPGC